jgi:hypothetical protein
MGSANVNDGSGSRGPALRLGAYQNRPIGRPGPPRSSLEPRVRPGFQGVVVTAAKSDARRPFVVPASRGQHCASAASWRADCLSVRAFGVLIRHPRGSTAVGQGLKGSLTRRVTRKAAECRLARPLLPGEQPCAHQRPYSERATIGRRLVDAEAKFFGRIETENLKHAGRTVGRSVFAEGFYEIIEPIGIDLRTYDDRNLLDLNSSSG